MDIDRVSAVLRKRSLWESIDFGFAMARAWSRSLFTPWLLVVVPIHLILLLALPLGWSLLALIWIRPLFDRVPLFVLSRGLFGEVPPRHRTLMGFWQSISWAWLWGLTVGRFQLCRPFLLPLSELEGLRGHKKVQRIRTLTKGYKVTGLMLTLTLFVVQLCLMSGLALLLSQLMPDDDGSSSWEFEDFSTIPDSFLWMFTGLWCLTEWLLAPFYVAGGFGLYINRRTELEGWDVELSFRSLARRITQESAPSSRAGPTRRLIVGLLFFIGLFGLGSETGAQTQTQAPVPVASDSLRQTMEEVLARPEFERDETRKQLQFTFDTGEMDNSSGFSLGASALLRIFLIAILVGFLLFVAYLIIRRGMDGEARKAREAQEDDDPPQTLFGLKLAPEALPRKIPEAAEKLLRDGRLRECLSILYQGALVDLLRHREVGLRRSSTEGDCLRLFQKFESGQSPLYFADLTRVWQQCAYGHEEPAFARVLAICRAWGQHFREPDLGGEA